MRKRIYVNVLLLLLLSTVLLSSSICFVLYDRIKAQETAAIKDRTILVADLLNRGIEENPFSDFISEKQDAARMTIIAPDGIVLLDNKTYADELENHGDREEVRKAIEVGEGEAFRISGSLGGMTYYYAIKLDDGNILRISKTMSSMIEIFFAALPVVIVITVCILLFANIIARRLTSNIIRPINTIDIENTERPVYEELLPFMKKIGQQKREIESQLLTLENRADTIKAITENMKEGLILIDEKGIILSANISAMELFHESAIEDKNILHICRDMDLLQAIRHCLSGQNSEMSFEREKRIYNVYLNPVRYRGEISGAVVLFLDTTEKYRAEKQRKEFSANVSHELKTPLTTISGLSEMIGNGMAKEEDIKGFASKISEQTKRLIHIIDDIIKLSEFDEGDIQKECTDVDLYEVAVLVKASLQEKADERQVSIEISGEHLQIAANGRMIDELLYNLMENGIKYNKDGGRVRVDLSALEGYYKIAVSDTGIGIPKKHLQRVFERFYRVDKSRSKKTGGTGLGLSIVKHITEYHKGKVEIESVEDVGTTVICVMKHMD